jgi:hypothetical protein
MVLEIEPRHATALASLGMVFHMREEYTNAIQKYHEVRAYGCGWSPSDRLAWAHTSSLYTETPFHRLSVSNLLTPMC